MEIQVIVQGLVIIVIVGVVYSLWQITRAYGGLIGSGLRWIGLGMIFFSLEALDRVLQNLSFITSFARGNAEMIHNLVLLLGLISVVIGFQRLTKIAK